MNTRNILDGTHTGKSRVREDAWIDAVFEAMSPGSRETREAAYAAAERESERQKKAVERARKAASALIPAAKSNRKIRRALRVVERAHKRLGGTLLDGLEHRAFVRSCWRAVAVARRAGRAPSPPLPRLGRVRAIRRAPRRAPTRPVTGTSSPPSDDPVPVPSVRTPQDDDKIGGAS